MLPQGIKKVMTASLLRWSRSRISHIKNMDEENCRVIMEEMSKEPDLVKTNRVYKPTYTIEFNREGEVLMYSADPLKNETIYFKYPFIFCTSGRI